MNRITEQLYISDLPETYNWETLQENNVDTIINVSMQSLGESFGMNPRRWYREFQIIHMPFPDGEPEYRKFEAAVETLLNALRRGDTVLIHCAAGISRSTSVAASALAIHNQTTFHDAMEIVERGRPEANPATCLRRYGDRVVHRHPDTSKGGAESVAPG